MVWLGLLGIAVVVIALLVGVFRWASAGPEVDRDVSKERFQAEQDWRALRRAGKP